MNFDIGKKIALLRHIRGVSQRDLAEALNVTVQAVSKWETGKANPDLHLLPKIADYFLTSIDGLFADLEDAVTLPEDAASQLKTNTLGWGKMAETDWKGTILPQYGNYTPTEDTLHLFEDIEGKSVLEVACGDGHSLLWMARHGVSDLYGLDISAQRIKQAESFLKTNHVAAKLFVSPMETDPGLPHRYFDLIYSIYGIGWTLDLDKTFSLIRQYLKPGGHFVFSWDNPLLQCIDAEDGKYILARSYVDEREIDTLIRGSHLHLHNWKLSSYLNALIRHGFYIEQVVEESSYDPAEAEIFREGKYYSAGLASRLNLTVIIKARKV